MPFVTLRRTRFPLLLTVNTALGSKIGLFLLATHTIVSGLFLYHIPRYLLYLEFPGEKKPSSKVCDDETNFSPSRMDLAGVIVSAANDNLTIKKKIQKLKM